MSQFTQGDAQHGTPLRGRHNPGDVRINQREIPAFERADVHDHVDLHRTELHRLAGLGGFGLGDRRAQRKTDDADGHHPGALEQAHGEGDPGGVEADRREVVLTRLIAELDDVSPGGVGLQQRVVDARGQLSAA